MTSSLEAILQSLWTNFVLLCVFNVLLRQVTLKYMSKKSNMEEGFVLVSISYALHILREAICPQLCLLYGFFIVIGCNFNRPKVWCTDTRRQQWTETVCCQWPKCATTSFIDPRLMVVRTSTTAAVVVNSQRVYRNCTLAVRLTTQVAGRRRLCWWSITSFRRP